MRECCRQVEVELVSKNSNKIHETWGPPISGALYNSHQSESFHHRNSINLLTFPSLTDLNFFPDEWEWRGGDDAEAPSGPSLFGHVDAEEDGAAEELGGQERRGEYARLPDGKI